MGFRRVLEYQAYCKGVCQADGVVLGLAQDRCFAALIASQWGQVSRDCARGSALPLPVHSPRPTSAPTARRTRRTLLHTKVPLSSALNPIYPLLAIPLAYLRTLVLAVGSIDLVGGPRGLALGVIYTILGRS